jgi:multiple sugar transport system permease protein
VATAVVWQRVLHPDFGILNTALGWFGIPPQPWLLDPGLAKPAFIFMSFWMIGRQMVIFIAGPRQHPRAVCWRPRRSTARANSGPSSPLLCRS